MTVFTTARHLALHRTRLIQSMPSHPISLRPVLILYRCLQLHLQRGLIPSAFPTKITGHVSFLCHTCYIPRQSNPSWFPYPNSIWRGEQIMKIFIMQLVQSPVLSPLLAQMSSSADNKLTGLPYTYVRTKHALTVCSKAKLRTCVHKTLKMFVQTQGNPN
jgi:hypothetical protein